MEREPSPRETNAPFELPEDLAAFLEQQGPYACLTHPTDQGTAFVLKGPGQEIAGVRGTVPVRVTHMLIDHPAAPVIRTSLDIYDQPDVPLSFESFINVADEQQRADFAAIADQRELLLLFYDEALHHRLTKQVTNTQPPETIRAIVERAQGLRARIPASHYNFDRAREDVLRRFPL